MTRRKLVSSKFVKFAGNKKRRKEARQTSVVRVNRYMCSFLQAQTGDPHLPWRKQTRNLMRPQTSSTACPVTKASHQCITMPATNTTGSTTITVRSATCMQYRWTHHGRPSLQPGAARPQPHEANHRSRPRGYCLGSLLLLGLAL